MDLNKAAIIVTDYNKLLHSNFPKAMEPGTMSEGLEAASVVMQYFKLVGCLESRNALYDTYKHIGHTLNQYYNETVAFLLDGKERPTNHHFYAEMFNAYKRQYESVDETLKDGSLSATVLNAMIGKKGTVTNFGDSHQSLETDQRLLSYADHDQLALWISRQGGVLDMIETLTIFLKIARP